MFALVSKADEGYGVQSCEVHTHPVLQAGQCKQCQCAGKSQRCQSAGFVFMCALVILELENTISKPLPHEGMQKPCCRTQSVSTKKKNRERVREMKKREEED